MPTGLGKFKVAPITHKMQSNGTSGAPGNAPLKLRPGSRVRGQGASTPGHPIKVI